jgi:hypothetical protein
MINRLQQNTKENIATSTVVSLVDMALDLQKKAFTSMFAAAGVVFIIGIIALTIILVRALYFNPPAGSGIDSKLRGTMLFLIWGSAALSFAAAFSLVQVMVALGFQRGSVVSSTPVSSGMASQILHWLSFSFTGLVAIGASVACGGSREGDAGASSEGGKAEEGGAEKKPEDAKPDDTKPADAGDKLTEVKRG